MSLALYARLRAQEDFRQGVSPDQNPYPYGSHGYKAWRQEMQRHLRAAEQREAQELQQGPIPTC